MANATALEPRAEFEELDGRFRRPLWRYFLRRVHTASEADDLTQEVFFRLLRRSPADRMMNTSAFIYTAAGNLLRDRARRLRSRQAEAFAGAAAESEGPVEEFTPERVLVSKERLSEVLACLDELPPKTRDAFLMFRLERAKQREIAQALGLSVSAVEKHVAKAVAHLTERFGVGASAHQSDGF